MGIQTKQNKTERKIPAEKLEHFENMFIEQAVFRKFIVEIVANRE